MPSGAGGTSWSRYAYPQRSSQSVRCGAVVPRSINAYVRCRKAAPGRRCGTVRWAARSSPEQSTARQPRPPTSCRAVLCGAVRWARGRPAAAAAAVRCYDIRARTYPLVERFAGWLTRRIYQSFARTARRRRARGRRSSWPQLRFVPHALVLIAMRAWSTPPAPSETEINFPRPAEPAPPLRLRLCGRRACAICTRRPLTVWRFT